MITLHTNFGDINIELDFEKAPISAANFLQYCRDDFYNNTIFHRVIDGFMIQGGGFTPEMAEKGGRESIENEADNGLVIVVSGSFKHFRRRQLKSVPVFPPHFLHNDRQRIDRFS